MDLPQKLCGMVILRYGPISSLIPSCEVIRCHTASVGYRPRRQPKQHHAKETRQRVLDAAAQVFAERGYSAGTTNRMAEHAELSIGSLYQYFPNKDAILRRQSARPP